jgi:hypothetical protein
MVESPISLTQPVSKETLRQLFNQHGYWEKLLSGQLKPHILRSVLASALAQQPPGTLSQIVSYLDSQGNEVARVHQYLRVDGTIGASGRPDPKKLLHNGVLYRLQKSPKRSTS